MTREETQVIAARQSQTACHPELAEGRQTPSGSTRFWKITSNHGDHCVRAGLAPARYMLVTASA